MSDQKSWIEGTPSKTSFVFGLILGLGIAALAGFIILLSVMFKGNFAIKGGTLAANAPAAAKAAQPAAEQPTTPVDIKLTSADHATGPKNAKVTVVEYSDFQCPYCGTFFPTIQQMLKEYKDKIQFVFRNFPLDQIHPNARPAAIAAECAGEQGKFFEYHDQLFTKQADLNDALYQTIASGLKLDLTKFNECLKSDRPTKKIDADEQGGLAIGVQGTPTTFVNGVPVSGAQPYAALKAKIDAALK